VETDAPTRREYRSPVLIESSSVVKLTRGTLTLQDDILMGGMRLGLMAMCL
jgi:hypothetical protein